MIVQKSVTDKVLEVQERTIRGRSYTLAVYRKQDGRNYGQMMFQNDIPITFFTELTSVERLLSKFRKLAKP